MPRKPPNAGKGRPKGTKTALALMTKEQKEEAWYNCRHAKLLRGEITWAALSDEELNQGFGYNPVGSFSGVVTKYGSTPSALLKERNKEVQKRFNNKNLIYAHMAADVVGEIMLDPDEKASDRLRAADMAINRAFGRAPELIAIAGDADNFDSLVAKIAGRDPGEEGYDPDISRIANGLQFGDLDDDDIVDVEWEETDE